MAFNPQYTSVADRARDRRMRREENEMAQWKAERERALFQAEMEKKANLAAEAAVKKRQALEKEERRSVYDSLLSAQGDLENFLGEEYESPQEKKDAFDVLSAKYEGNTKMQQILQASAAGREDLLPSIIGRVEEDLLSRGEIEPVKRRLAVTKSGQIAPIAEGSSRFLRELNKHEQYALDQGIDPNSPEFNTFVDMHRNGRFEKVRVIVPGRGPQEMEKWQAESLGLDTEEQYNFQQTEAERLRSENDAREAEVKERREEIRKMQSKADSFRSNSNVALENISKARGLLEIVREQGDDLTGPEGIGTSIMAGLGKRTNFKQLRDALESALTQIKSNVALDKMNEMKSQSATGATGFGSMQKNELDLITGALGSLEVENNTTEGLIESLDAVEGVLRKATDGFVPGETVSLSSKNPFGAEEGANVVFLGGDPDDPDNWEIVP